MLSRRHRVVVAFRPGNLMRVARAEYFCTSLARAWGEGVEYFESVASHTMLAGTKRHQRCLTGGSILAWIEPEEGVCYGSTNCQYFTATHQPTAGHAIGGATADHALGEGRVHGIDRGRADHHRGDVSDRRDGPGHHLGAGAVERLDCHGRPGGGE